MIIQRGNDFNYTRKKKRGHFGSLFFVPEFLKNQKGICNQNMP